MIAWNYTLILIQNSMYTWARDHRVHHKYSDTDADPHNASRGFIFSHFGWLLFKKHPLVKEKTKCINVSDLLDEKLLMIQHKWVHDVVHRDPTNLVTIIDSEKYERSLHFTATTFRCTSSLDSFAQFTSRFTFGKKISGPRFSSRTVSATW